MSKIDKIIRILIGSGILIYFGLFYPTWWAYLGLIPLMSGVSEFCPIYKIFKKNPNKNKSKKPDAKKRKFLKSKADNEKPLFKD